MKKIRCTVIGDGLEPLERPLRRKGILFDVIINSCSPLAMAAETDETNLKYCDNPQMPMPMLLNLRKNLSQMLSRDPEHFCQNYNLQPYAKEVRYQNDTDYIIVINTSIGYSLYQKGDVVYSDTGVQNKLIDSLKADGGYIQHSFPFERAFNWRYFYDRFIDAILNEYDSEHIIFIRTHLAQWYMEGQEIKPFEDRPAQFRRQVEEMDRYFIERTHCLCIDEALNHIPDKNETGISPFLPKNELIYSQLERCIEEIIDGKTDRYQAPVQEYSTPLAKNLCWKLSSNIVQENAKQIKFISEHQMVFSGLEKSSGNSEFFKDIIELKSFLDPDQSLTLSDYIRNQSADGQKVDISLVRLYLRYMKLDINDIISAYYLGSADKTAAGVMAEIILNHPDCRPVAAAQRFRNRNIAFLQSYQYIQPELKEAGNAKTLMIALGNNCCILLDPDSCTPIQKVTIAAKDDVDHLQIIGNGYVCPIEAADALCSSYKFYIERAKRGEGNRPVRIVFPEQERFDESLYYIDYTDILNNENFLLSIADDWNAFPQFFAKCDLSFLFQENVNICIIRSGFTDQICYYIVSKRLEEVFKLRSVPYSVYLDDTIYDYIPMLNGLELQKVVREDLRPKLISNLLSAKLLDQINENTTLPDVLFANGCNRLGLVTQSPEILRLVHDCSKAFISVPRRKAGEFLERSFDFSPVYYYSMIRPEHFMRTRVFDLNEYLVFPDFKDETNRSIADSMLVCDAVVIHIRLGDAAALGMSVDTEYYVECIKKLLNIPDYENKKYFVFSDNIPWVKEHRAEVGLDLLGNDEVIFVDHNKYEESYRDMQLMTLAKVIISSNSGMVRMAALLSKRCEQFFTWKKGLVKIFEDIGRRNKYEIGSFSRDYG